MEGQEESKLRLEDLRIETVSFKLWKPVTDEATDKDASFELVEIPRPEGEAQVEETVVLVEDSSAADALASTTEEPAESVQSVGQNAKSAEAPTSEEGSLENMADKSSEHVQLQDSTLDTTKVQDLEPASGSKLTDPEEPQKEEPETKNPEAVSGGKTTVLDEPQRNGTFSPPDDETLKSIQHESQEVALDDKFKTDEPNAVESPPDQTSVAKSTPIVQNMPKESTVDKLWTAESLFETGVKADEPESGDQNTVESLPHQTVLDGSTQAVETEPEESLITENPNMVDCTFRAATEDLTPAVESKPEKVTIGESKALETSHGQTIEPEFAKQSQDQTSLEDLTSAVESTAEKSKTTDNLPDPPAIEISTTVLETKTEEPSEPGDPRTAGSVRLQAPVDNLTLGTRPEVPAGDGSTKGKRLQDQAVLEDSVPVAEAKQESSVETEDPEAVESALEPIASGEAATLIETEHTASVDKAPTTAECLPDQTALKKSSQAGEGKPPKPLSEVPTAEDENGLEKVRPSVEGSIEEPTTRISASIKPAELVANVPTTATSLPDQTSIENSILAVEIEPENPVFEVPTAEDEKGLEKGRPSVEGNIEELTTTEVSRILESELDPVVSEDLKPIVENKLHESTVDDPKALDIIHDLAVVLVGSTLAVKYKPKETESEKIKSAQRLQGQSALKESTSAVPSANCKPVEETQLVEKKVVDKLPVELKEVETTPATVLEDDDYSYEEIVVDDDDEFFEYVDEILDEEYEEDMFTDVTYESQDHTDEQFIVNGLTTDGSIPGRPVAKSQSSRASLDGSNHRRPVVKGQPSRSSIDGSNNRRPVIKSATQKALEEEEARKRAEAEEALKSVEYRIARRNSFTCKDEAFVRQLEEEEAEHIRQEEERERQRIAEQERLAQIKAAEAAARIARQEKEELRRRLVEEEARRKSAEAEAHRLAAEAAARKNEAAEKSRRKAEEAERLERDTKKKAMENEVRKLEAKLAEAKKAAVEAKLKQVEEKNRLKAKVEARRKEKKEIKEKATDSSSPEVSKSARGSKATAVEAASPERVSKASVSGVVSSPTRLSKARGGLSEPKEVAPAPAAAAPAAPAAPASAKTASANTNSVYYTADELRKESVPGLDYKNREIYLHPNDFQQFFGMTLAEFDLLPKWKKTSMKRKQKLF